MLLKMVGSDYKKYSNKKRPNFFYPASIVSIEGNITNQNAILNDSEDCMIINQDEKIKSSSVVIDFGKEIVGCCGLLVQNPKRTTIELRFGETLDECLQEDSQRTEWWNKPVICEIYPKFEKWEKIHPMRLALRYLKVTFKNIDGPIYLQSVFVQLCGYPVKYLGYFSCSDELLNQIWQTGCYTVELCMQSTYEDGVKRDRCLWNGDLQVEALVNYYAFGDDKLIRESLDKLSRDKFDDGAIRSVAPGDGLGGHDGIVIWDYVGWWIISVYDYYLHTGDKEFLQSQYDNLKGAIEWYINLMDSNNLLYQVKTYEHRDILSEWSCSNRLGEKTYLNAVFYKSLLCMKEINQWLNKGGKEYIRYEKIAIKVKEAINKQLWSEEKGAYIDFKTKDIISDRVPQDGNSMAVLFGIADDKQTKSILEFLKKNHWGQYGSAMIDKPYKEGEPPYYIVGVINSKNLSPFMTFFELESHLIKGDEEDGLELIKRLWGGMIKKGATSFWEYAPNGSGLPGYNASCCHGWSAGASYSLHSTVLGIKPIAPGFKKIEVQPHLGNLSWAKGVIPTPLGLISVAHSKNKQNYKTILLLPKGCQAEILIHKSAKKIFINGKLIKNKKTKVKNKNFVGILLNKKGKHIIYTIGLRVID